MHWFRLWIGSAVILLAGCGRGGVSGPLDRSEIPLRAWPALIARLQRSPLPQAQEVTRPIEYSAHDLPRQRTAARREGIPLTPKELQAPAVPAALNAAPIYVRLTGVLKDHPLDRKTDEIASGVGMRFTHTPAEIDAVRHMLAERRDVMDLVHQAVRRPRCVFHRDWSLGPALIFPEYATMREATRLLKAESYLMARKGHYREAVANLSGGFRIAEHGASDPLIIAYLVGIACDAITLAGMEDILYMAGPRDDVAKQVRAAVLVHRPQFRFRRALDGEVVLALAIFELCRQQGPSVIDPPNPSDADEAPQPEGRTVPSSEDQERLTPQERRAWRMLVDAGEAEYLRRMLPAFAAVKKPFRIHRSTLERLDATEPSSGKPTDLFLTLLGPVFLAADRKQFQVQAQEEVIMTGAALLAYKARHRSFPQRLEQAVPRPPLDPFSGKPLRYRREGTGFVVYSVGADGNFTGGSPGMKREPTQAYFRYPAPPPQRPTPSPAFPMPPGQPPGAPPGLSPGPPPQPPGSK